MDEINETRNREWRRWKVTGIEWIAVIIAGFAALVTVVWGGAALLQVGYMSGRIDAQDRYIEDLSGNIAVYRIRTAKLNAYLAAHGINPEEIYDEQ